mmetsp:Transcript_20450/g.42876  ORF Transcript_20450/g.42876 Transcript_20450/m.42876 type:complete len:364 (+) Transcript_20450:111-1202(+)
MGTSSYEQIPLPRNNIFAAVAVGSFIATTAAVLIFLRVALTLYHRCGVSPDAASNRVTEAITPEKKKQINDLRSDAIRRHLKNFTVTLTENDILPAQNELGSMRQLSVRPYSEDVTNEKPTHGESEEEKIEIDEEMMTYDVEQDEEEGDEEDNLLHEETDTDNDLPNEMERGMVNEKYTLLTVPLANKSNNNDDTSTSINDDDDDDGAATSCNIDTNKSPQKFHIQLNKLHEQQHHESTSSIDPITNSDNSMKTILIDECAICQEAYKLNDTICHSSNPQQCTHVFHQDCIVGWLASLGWMKLKEQRSVYHNQGLLSLHHDDEEYNKLLLDYDLECPCCRQSFIDKSLLCIGTETKREGEHNV